MTLYLCPLVVVTGHCMDITDQCLQGDKTDLNTAVFVMLKVDCRVIRFHLFICSNVTQITWKT